MDKGSCSPSPCGTEKGTCCGKIIKGAILGGLVMWFWFFVSWHVLPWHSNSLIAFKDEKAVADVLAKNAPDANVYVLPFTDMGKVDQKIEKPFAFVSVVPQGVNVKDTMPQMMIGAFVMSVLLAGGLSCLLTKKVEGFCPVAFSMKVGLLTGIAAFGPSYIFYHFPANWCLVGIADQVIAFALVGAVVGKCIMKMKLGMQCPASACGPAAGSCGAPDDKNKK
jgi:hypothetical protein